MAIADYLRKLVELKNQLVANLKNMGVAADESEKLNTLVPKVLECKAEQNVEFVEGTNFDSLKANVKKVAIPAGVTSIGSRAFEGCSSLASITIPNSVTTIGDHAFEYCASLANINIPAGVTSIGSYTFHSCESLASITIGNSVTSIRGYAFSYCPSLKSIIIPDSVTSIGAGAFEKCRYVSDIYYTGTQEQWNAIAKATDWNTNMGSNVSGGTVIHYNYIP